MRKAYPTSSHGVLAGVDLRPLKSWVLKALLPASGTGAWRGGAEWEEVGHQGHACKGAVGAWPPIPLCLLATIR